LKYYDSVVMKGYRYPHKALETVYCRKEPMPDSCYRDEEVRPNVPVSAFDVRMSGVGDGSGRGVFAMVDIKKGSAIGRENPRRVHIPSSPLRTIDKYMGRSKSIRDVFSYADGYGGETHTFVSDWFIVLMMHSCIHLHFND